MDADGAVFDPGEGTRAGLHVDAITEEACTEYRGRTHARAAVGKRKRKDVSGARDRRQPRCMPEDMPMEDAARDKRKC